MSAFLVLSVIKSVFSNHYDEYDDIQQALKNGNQKDESKSTNHKQQM